MPDRSIADFNWCMTCLDPEWGGNVDEFAARLLEVSETAREMEYKSRGYAETTVRNAAEWVARRQRGRA